MNLSEAPLATSSVNKLSCEDWVEMQMIHIFMRYARPALHAALALIITLLFVLHGHVDSAALGVWALAVTAITLVRYRVIGIYHRDLVGVSGPALRAFMARYTWTWPLSAALWGSSMFVFFLRAPLYDQFICMMVLTGMGGFAVGTFSSHLRCFAGYINGLGFSVLASLAYLMVERGVPSHFNTYGIVALMLVYWVLLLTSGRRFHEVQRASLELQFANSTLIASLTEQRRAALEAVKIKNSFIASAAHDLRQPVHALALYAGWLASEPQLAPQIAPKIVRSTKAVNELFDTLFDLAGLQSDPLRVNLQTVDLARLAQDLELQYAPLASERKLGFRTRVAAASVESDPVLLKRLVGNLLSNALRNTEQGGVLLAVRRRQGVWCMEVWDTGTGIAEVHQTAIFQEFFRIPMQGTEQGFGLGLAIVSRLSQALGYPVSMASRMGRGSVFRVELRPVQAAPAA
ncbi:MAG: HAMP domain-containing sensor histidine kinase [Polaromonas sp.]